MFIDQAGLKKKFMELAEEAFGAVPMERSWETLHKWAKETALKVLVEACETADFGEVKLKEKPLIDSNDIKPIYDREAILRGAAKCVLQDSNNTYGKPENGFMQIADLWNAYLQDKNVLEPYDVANLMILLKVQRAKANPHHIDSFIDIAGYAACAGELADDSRSNSVFKCRKL